MRPATETSTNSMTIPRGEFTIDPAHSWLGFAVRHMVTPVHGEFSEFTGHGLVAGSDLAASSVAITIDAATIHTRQDDRDAHLRSADFFDVERYPTITFRSTDVRAAGRNADHVTVVGDLTIKDTTRPVELDFTYHGAATDPYGQLRLGFTGRGAVSRKLWGLTWNVALAAGGFVLGDSVTVDIDISALLTPAAPEPDSPGRSPSAEQPSNMPIGA